MKKNIISVCVTLIITVFMSGCSSDDDEIFGTGLTGKWDLVEVQNGPAGFCKGDYANQYPSGTVIMRTEKLKPLTILSLKIRKSMVPLCLS